MLVRVVAGVVLVLALAAPASADHAQPAPDVSKLGYAPIGTFGPGEPVPPADACVEQRLEGMEGKRFNPSGNYNAFDSNVFEVLCLPYRAAGDESAEDPYGNGGNPVHGQCAPNPVPRPGPEAVLSSVGGECPNHQLEYIEYYKESMQDVLGDFGVTFREYEFHNPGSGNTESGRGINPAAIVPGADHPDETVVIGAHFDQTTEGPASAWDSAEGHAQVIRVAKLMADYWRATGTRPSATVKFIPWDGEESGTLGSRDYAANNIVPGEEHEVRGYFNTDPCAGGYPAFRNGQPAARIALGVQLARADEVPAEFRSPRVDAFNAKATQVVEDVLEKVDDTVPTVEGEVETFISQNEAAASGGSKQADTRPGGPIIINGERPVLFSSDWANFLAKGVPFFNPGPDVTGPSDEGSLGNPDGLAILHTPNDNILTLNRLTGPDQSGTTFSAGWMKGMEFCANILAWGMLRGDQGGAQVADEDVVAYYEALPNEATTAHPVRFDARGTYQYADAATRRYVDPSVLEYSWDFGDGMTGSGQRPAHVYREPGVYTSRLTVTNTQTGQASSMAVPVTVLPSSLAGPTFVDPPASDEDGTFSLSWEFDEGARSGFSGYRLEESSDYATITEDDAETGPAAKWTVSETPAGIAPWQPSDSATPKIRGNQRHGGDRSFWTGVPADDNVPARVVVSGESVLTLRETFRIPAGGGQLTYWSLFQNEGDDRGVVEVASADAPGEWKAVDTIVAVNTSLGGPDDEAICSPSQADMFVRGLGRRVVDLGAYAGQEVRLRFRMVYGAENRLLSQPCGWYVDDVLVDGGTFTTVAETAEKTAAIADRDPGSYAYRVTGIYGDGVVTRPSERVLVQVGPSDIGGAAAAAEARRKARGEGARAAGRR